MRLSADARPARLALKEPPARLVALVVLALSAAYLGRHLDRGWVPMDEGALAHAAQRVLEGQLPHRDYDEVYTGGQAIVNAAAFRLLGTTLWSLRLVLFAAFLAWVPAVHYVASRFVRPLLAAGVTLLAVAWSVPNYPAAMPSWYNLFLATIGVAAVLRHLEDGRRRWLVAAGVAGGASFLVKLVGLYYVAGVLLFLVFHAHARSRERAGPGADAGRGYALFVTGSLLLFLAAVAAVVRGQLALPELVQFVLPSAAVVALLVRNEWSLPAGPSGARLRELLRSVIPFAGGVLLPVALFLVPYARSGALGDFAYGVFVLPAKRLGHVSFALPLMTLVALVPAGALAYLVARPRGAEQAAFGRRGRILLALALAALLLACGSMSGVYRLVLFTMRALVPVLAVATVWLLALDRDPAPAAALRRARLVALVSVIAVYTLVQFPFTVAIYFCYVAPLVALAVVAFVAYLDRPAPAGVAALATAFCLGFAVLWLNRSPLNDMDTQYEPYPEVRPLALDRGGLTVPLFQAGQYEEVVRVVREHARGPWIWASPDSPQLYFLTGRRNPTRTMFELFDDTTNGSARILRTLDERRVDLVVLNVRPGFSPRIPVSLYRELAKRYPNSAFVEPYLIKWRE